MLLTRPAVGFDRPSAAPDLNAGGAGGEAASAGQAEAGGRLQQRAGLALRQHDRGPYLTGQHRDGERGRRRRERELIRASRRKLHTTSRPWVPGALAPSLSSRLVRMAS